MNGRVWIALACLVAGVPIAAWGLANGSLLIGMLGLAFVLVFIFLVVEAMNRASQPKHEIPKSDSPAWSMKDAPPRTLERKRGDGGSL
jgi:Na+-transporting methylmalonyl-CoA/oxaloacetate decarboxylase gamma subunit